MLQDTAVFSPLESEFANLAERLCHSTVQFQEPRGGSGVIWHANGLIVTNAHVIHGSKARVKLFDERVLEAVVTAQNRQRDLAALTVDAAGLPAAAVRTSALRVGELVLAVGNPHGLRGVLTTGIIQAIAPANTGKDWVRADVQLAPGNSGGPLADAQGRVIGINSMIVDGLALAVPSNAVAQFLRSGGKRPYLGVSLQPVLVSQSGQRVGLLVLEVTAGSPAEVAGLLIGDILIGAGGQCFRTPEDLAYALSSADCDELQLDLLRGGQRRQCRVRGASKSEES